MKAFTDLASAVIQLQVVAKALVGDSMPIKSITVSRRAWERIEFLWYVEREKAGFPEPRGERTMTIVGIEIEREE